MDSAALCKLTQLCSSFFLSAEVFVFALFSVKFRPLSAGDLLRNPFRAPKALNTNPTPDPAHGWNA
jgi:hypothetical protein